jgi:uncharacterized protein
MAGAALMDDSFFLAIDISGVAPEHGAPPPERVVEGDPRFTTWNAEAREGDTLFSGIWEATPGAWRIAYTEWEFCTILFGVSEIAAEDGTSRRVSVGDSFILRPGFRGVWRVIETTRKAYVVRL